MEATVFDRVMAKIGEPTATGCWPWLGGKKDGSYGNAWIRRGVFRAAHRVVYELLIGPIPDGLTLDHLCRRPDCVNPTHLEPVTKGENTMRGAAPTVVAWRAGTCTRGHDASNFYRRRSTGEVAYCRVCKLDAIHRRAAA